MSSNNYNPYTFPYQQSSAQQYSAYQTAPASNNVTQPSRQYQQPSTTQANDYMPYQGQSYGGQSNGYGTAQDSSWNGSSYGDTRETTRGAAEVLRNMSNNTYTPNNPATSQPSFPAANTTTSQPVRCSTGNSNSPLMQPQQAHATQSSYGLSQPRSRSVNTNSSQRTSNQGLPSPATTAGYPLERVQTKYNQQRSASPVQHKYSNSSAAPVPSARSTAIPAVASQHYSDYDRRQLASVDASRTSQNSAPPASYTYGNSGPVAPPPPSATETYTGQGSITVDPMAVYDPWPEYQRKQEAIRAQKAVEDAARAQDEKVAEEARKTAEAEAEAGEEQKRQEALVVASQLKQKANNPQKQPSSIGATSAAADADAGPGTTLETEIRAMMAKMRELNSKDPALLARIWEEERRAKAAPKSPTIQNNLTIQTAVSAEPAQPNTLHVANQKKIAPAETPRPSITKPAIPVSVPAVAARSQGVSSARQGGHTIWPPEKKTQLAFAAATYLNNENTTTHVDPARILIMLNGNPSYIDLCQQLENMGLKLDRAAFAKSLLTAVPDVNSSTRKPAHKPVPIQRTQVPAAVMKREITTPAAASPGFTSAAPPPANRSAPSFLDNASPAATPVPVAEMVPIKPELKPPANKEEAARKRNLSELVDLTLLDDEVDMGPPPKKPNVDAMYSYRSPYPCIEEGMIVDSEPINNFPVASVRTLAVSEPAVQTAPLIDREIRYRAIVEPLDKKKALRRNTYNPATIARDVLLACGRHPSERQLNQHLDVLRSNLPHIGFDIDLSTIKWDILDPGNPPPGYFKDGVQALTEDANDEDGSEDEDQEARLRVQSNVIGGESGAQARVQALPEAINPFIKQKKRGRPARHSLPNSSSLATPKSSPSSTNMSTSAPRPTAANVGYSAFRSTTQYGPDGQPLPKKRGRPVGWRKAIHGSGAAQVKPPFSNHQPSQPSSLRNIKTGEHEPIRIDSESPSVASRVPHYQSYKCQWQNCTAELHNLETLSKHVFKVHRKETLRKTLECLWGDCGKEVTSLDPNTNMRIEKHSPYAFDLESNWKGHIQQNHFDPLSWRLGDGPASGLSDTHDSEAYLSDAQNRQVTPRITVDRNREEKDLKAPQAPVSTSGGRGRPPKNSQENEAREAQERLILHKKRIGGPGMDRGGATLVNDKRRKGFIDSDGTEEELVDVDS